MRRRVVSCILAMLLSFGITAARAADKTFSFGALFPLTGPASEIGEIFVRGLDMAVADINAKGGAAGWTLKPIVLDHKGTAQGGVMAMNQLANLYHVPYVISSFAAVDLASQPIAAQNQIFCSMSAARRATCSTSPGSTTTR